MAETLLKSVRVRERWGDINLYDKNGSPEYKWIGRGFDFKISVFKSGLTGKKRIVRAFDEGGAERGSGDPQKGDRYSSKTLKFFNPIEYNIDDSLDWGFGEYGDNAFIYQYITTQAAILKREKYYDGTAWQPSSYTNAELPDIILAEWISIISSNSGISTKLRSPDYFGQSLNETDKIYRKKFGYLPPYFEIIQDPFIEPQDEFSKNKLKLRNFGTDRYYLNNGSSISIEWSTNDSGQKSSISSTDYSDNWQRELDTYDIGLKDEYFKSKILKQATIYGPNDERFTIATERGEGIAEDEKDILNPFGTIQKEKDVGFLLSRDIEQYFETYKKIPQEVNGQPNPDFVSFTGGTYSKYYAPKIYRFNRVGTKRREIEGESNVKKIYQGSDGNGSIYDEEILKEILEKWQQVYGNTKLKLNDDPLSPIASIEFVMPVLASINSLTAASPSGMITSSASTTGTTGATGATGASASAAKRITGTYIFDVTKKDYLINAELGELLILEKETIEDPFTLPFEESEEDLKILSNEYYETAYSGLEESIVEEQNFESEEVRIETEKQADKINTSTPGSTYENYVQGKHKLDMLPGEYVTNSKAKIKCCQIHGKPINVAIADALLDMIEAAKKDGIKLKVNSGFRPAFDPNLSAKSEGGVSVSAQSQEDLYRAYLKKGSPDTAKPGSSKHGSGIAIDINTGGRKNFSPLNEANYKWMVKNSWKFGFVRTVGSEEWHYEYWPEKAKAGGPYGKLPKSNALFYAELGLNNLQGPNYA